MAAGGSMRRVWMGISLSIALLSVYPAWIGRTSWWWFGIAMVVFGIFLIEPWLLTWEIRKRGDALQITDEGVLRRLARGGSEYVRWSDLREVSVLVGPIAGSTDDYVYVLAGTGRSGVLVGQALATRHDLLSHLAKLPGFDHRNMSQALYSPPIESQGQRYLLWQARPIEGDAQVIPMNRLGNEATRTLH
jgi:hypothetical protein